VFPSPRSAATYLCSCAVAWQARYIYLSPYIAHVVLIGGRDAGVYVKKWKVFGGGDS
jgi:hypothetical protein